MGEEGARDTGVIGFKNPLDVRFNCVGKIRRNVKRFNGVLVFKAHKNFYHSTRGWRVTKKKRVKSTASVKLTEARCTPAQEGNCKAT